MSEPEPLGQFPPDVLVDSAVASGAEVEIGRADEYPVTDTLLQGID